VRSRRRPPAGAGATLRQPTGDRLRYLRIRERCNESEPRQPSGDRASLRGRAGTAGAQVRERSEGDRPGVKEGVGAGGSAARPPVSRPESLRPGAILANGRARTTNRQRRPWARSRAVSARNEWPEPKSERSTEAVAGPARAIQAGPGRRRGVAGCPR